MHFWWQEIQEQAHRDEKASTVRYNVKSSDICIARILIYYFNSAFDSRTFKQGCPAGIKLCLSVDRKYLEVKEVVDDHNHEVSKVSYTAICRHV